MNSKLEIIREYKRLTEQCSALVEIFCQFDATLDKFEKESGTSVKEAIQILDEIGDNNADLIRLTIARLTESIGTVEPIKVPTNVEIPTVIETTPQVVEVAEESTETSQEEKESSSQEEISSNDITKEDPHKKIIDIPGYPHKVTVYDDGNVYVDSKHIEPDLDASGVMIVDLPIIGGGTFRIAQHRVVAMAFLPPMPVARDQLVHRNGNAADCRVKNIAWKSTVKREIPRIDASDAIDISEALVECKFDQKETMRLLQSRHKRCTPYAINLIKNKKAFREVSDKYFDEKLHIVKQVKVPELEIVETKPIAENVSNDTSLISTISIEPSKVFNRTHAINNALEACSGDILKAFESTKSLIKGLTIYEVFNVKNDSKGRPSFKDIAVVIRCAGNGGGDIKEILRNECSLIVNDNDIVRATRKNA
jgi:hypothetical protein